MAIPQGIGKEQFFNAIEELVGQIGNDNVRVNDQPLQDGW